MIQKLSLFTLAFAFLACSSPAVSSQALFSNRYDDAIRSSVKRNWPDFPEWQFWKAQLYQESRFDPNARSAVGAYGIAQFMPATWDDITHQLGWSGISANQAEPAIEAGAFYMHKLRHGWAAPRPESERHLLGVASYNSGTGNIVKAQALCHGAPLFSGIAPCLPQVTGPLARQTIDYVAKIQEWRQEIGQ